MVFPEGCSVILKGMAPAPVLRTPSSRTWTVADEPLTLIHSWKTQKALALGTSTSSRSVPVLVLFEAVNEPDAPDVCACAGKTVDSMTGFTQLSWIDAAVTAVPPPARIFFNAWRLFSSLSSLDSVPCVLSFFTCLFLLVIFYSPRERLTFIYCRINSIPVPNTTQSIRNHLSPGKLYLHSDW